MSNRHSAGDDSIAHPCIFKLIEDSLPLTDMKITGYRVRPALLGSFVGSDDSSAHLDTSRDVYLIHEIQCEGIREDRRNEPEVRSPELRERVSQKDEGAR